MDPVAQLKLILGCIAQVFAESAPKIVAQFVYSVVWERVPR